MADQQFRSARFDNVILASGSDLLSDEVRRYRNAPFGVNACLRQFIALIHDVAGDVALNYEVWDV
ncbi:hypothetical protein D3C75_1210430 [compost metagenome]